MPVHDWTRLEAFVFHGFHTRWIVHLSEFLNQGVLPKGFYSDCEQITTDRSDDARIHPDILALRRPSRLFEAARESDGAVAVAETLPVATRVTVQVAPKPRRSVVIRHASRHQVVALIEIVSPANKDRLAHVEDFAEKVAGAISAGIHVLVLDLLPPGRHDPNGLHEAIIQQFGPQTYEIPAPSRRTFASYVAGPGDGFIEHPEVGAPLPPMPLFLTQDRYINVDLEPSYSLAFRGTPDLYREILEPA